MRKLTPIKPNVRHQLNNFSSSEDRNKVYGIRDQRQIKYGVGSGITGPGSGITGPGSGITGPRSGITGPGSGITRRGIGISVLRGDQGLDFPTENQIS